MRIAIVGATGMLGHHTAVATIAAGHELVVVCRNSSSLHLLAALTFEARQADLNDRAALRLALMGVDAVINCAAYSPTVLRPWRDEVLTATSQMQGFYEVCADLSLRKIVYLGGSIALPRNPRGRAGSEQLRYEAQPRNKNPYLQVKWAMDEQALSKAVEGLPVVIGIPSMAFGEFDMGNSTGRIIVEMANRTMPGYVEGMRNVIYAGDAGRGMVRVCEAGRIGERYLLAGENLTMRQLMAKISAVTGAPMPKSVPISVARVIVAWQSFQHARFGGDKPKVNASAIAVMSLGQFIDGSKAQSELNFRAEVSIYEAIQRSLTWFRKMGLVNN
jgi:dihydroflavonol-4-reductase